MKARESRRKWRLANREWKLESDRKYREAHREQKNAYDRVYHATGNRGWVRKRKRVLAQQKASIEQELTNLRRETP